MPDPNPYTEFDSTKNGAFSYPYDYLHFISMHKGGGSGTPRKIKLLTLDQFAKRRSSVIVPINQSNLVAVMIDEGFEVYDAPASEIIETWNAGTLEPFSQSQAK